jgi:Cof subfamily protein (haloacid dehalogenase superfamily)
MSNASQSGSMTALAIDLDGTLLVGESLSKRNASAVKAAFDAGYKVIIATARWRQLAERISDEIGLHGLPIIACSGAQVYCTRQKEDIFDARLPADFVTQLFEICNENRCVASATLDAHTWLKIDKKPAAEYLSEEMSWVAQLPESDELPRIATVQGSATIALVNELHKQHYAEAVNIFNSIGPSGRNVITITAKDADKGTALQRACNHLQIETNQVIAFGDADNDIAMFKLAGQSVAMGQADDTVKGAASFITGPNDADGVAEFIETKLLSI